MCTVEGCSGLQWIPINNNNKYLLKAFSLWVYTGFNWMSMTGSINPSINYFYSRLVKSFVTARRLSSAAKGDAADERPRVDVKERRKVKGTPWRHNAHKYIKAKLSISKCRWQHQLRREKTKPRTMERRSIKATEIYC